jgi:hypothetical protein
LVDLRCLRFCQSYIGCPEHFNPLQQFVLLRNVLGGSYGRQPARLPHQDKPANLLIIRGFLMTSTGNPCHYNRIYRSFSWTQSEDYPRTPITAPLWGLTRDGTSEKLVQIARMRASPMRTSPNYSGAQLKGRTEQSVRAKSLFRSPGCE